MVARKHADAAKCKAQKTWGSTPTANLIRYLPKGTYYLRARIGGKIIRESLDTTKYDIATRKLNDRLRDLRLARGSKAVGAPDTLVDALRIVRIQVENDPSLKERTKESYTEQIDCLFPGRPGAVPVTSLSKLSSREMAQWWSKLAEKYHEQRANHFLMWTRRALKVARQMGSLIGDPSEDLKRLKIPRTRLKLLTADQFRALIASVRAQNKAKSEEAANWIEFMIYGGMRPAEICAVEWKHIDLDGGYIRVVGGVQGTKNRQERTVPMIAAMRDLIERMKGEEEKTGRVFTLTGPRDALKNACKRLGLPHMRVYDLRHAFATLCNESGVDVPTFAKWLGHKDGGSLAMRTYVHPTDEHSQRSAAKVKF